MQPTNPSEDPSRARDSGRACHVEVVVGRRALDGLVPEWDDLAQTVGTWFQTTSWVLPWFEHFAAGADCRTYVARDAEGTLLGLLPLARLSRGLHRRVPLPLHYWGLAGSGSGAADHLGPLASPAAGSALLIAAIRWAERNTLLLEHLSPQWAELAIRAGMRPVAQIAVPALDLPISGDIEQLWSKKLRKEMRRRALRMSELGIVGRWYDDPGDVADYLPALVEVHRSRWRSQGQNGLFSDARLQFLRDVCLKCAESRSEPQLHLLQIADRTVAALLGFRHGRTFYAYKTGWEPEFGGLGLGLAMHAEAIRRTRDEGGTTYDFLRGTSRHKYSLGGTDRFDTTLLSGRGPTAWLLGERERTR